MTDANYEMIRYRLTDEQIVSLIAEYDVPISEYSTYEYRNDRDVLMAELRRRYSPAPQRVRFGHTFIGSVVACTLGAAVGIATSQ